MSQKVQITDKNKNIHCLQALLRWLLNCRGAACAGRKKPQQPGGGCRDVSAAIEWRLVLGITVLAMPAGYASETTPGDFQLYAQPSICVSYNSDEPCRMSMEVSWEGDNAADVCLRDAEEEPMLYCWENMREGSVEIHYADTGDVVYQLVDEASLGVLAETEIKVINRDLRSSRKRRRHVWSIL